MALLDKLGRIKPIWDASKDTTPYLAYGPFIVEDPRRSYIAMYLSAVKEPNRQISLQWFDNIQIIAKLVVGNPEIVDDKISFRAFSTDNTTDRYLIRPLTDPFELEEVLVCLMSKFRPISFSNSSALKDS